MLLTSLVGTSYPWASVPIIVMGVAGVVLLIGWALVEHGRHDRRECGR